MHPITIHVRGQSLQVDLAKQAVTIGRHKDASIIIGDDHRLSRIHCSLQATPQGVLLQDMNSRNGTWANGRKIDSLLLHQDTVFVVGSLQVQVALPPRRPGVGSAGAGRPGADRGRRRTSAEHRAGPRPRKGLCPRKGPRRWKCPRPRKGLRPRKCPRKGL